MTARERADALARSCGYTPPDHISAHAVDRFRERYRPHARRAAAKAELRAEAGAATLVSIVRKDQVSIWRSPCGALLVVHRNGTVMTCLPADAQAPIGKHVLPRRAG